MYPKWAKSCSIKMSLTIIITEDGECSPMFQDVLDIIFNF